MPRIFISYKREDKNKVFPLKEKIEAATGEKCWIDLDGIIGAVIVIQNQMHMPKS